MERLPKEIETIKSVSIPIDPKAMKLGSNGNKEELEYNRFLGRGSKKINRLILKYLNSYRQEQFEDRTLLHLRDYLLGQALGYLHRSVLTKDTEFKNLTTQAQHLYANYDVTKIWGLRKKRFIFNREGSAGNYSSLTWLIQDLNNYSFDEPLSLGRELLDEVWRRFDVKGTANEKNRQFIEAVFDRPLGEAKTRFNQLETDLSQQTNPELRKRLITSNDWNNLFGRLLLGEYKNDLVEVLGLSEIRSNLLEKLPPFGSVGFYLAFLAEGFLEAAEYLSSLEDSILFTQFDDFLENKRSYPDIKQSLAKPLTISLAALAYLRAFSTLEEADFLFTTVLGYINDLIEDKITPELEVVI